MESNLDNRKPDKSDEENLKAFNSFTPGYPYRPDVDMANFIPDTCPNKAKVGRNFFADTTCTALLLCFLICFCFQLARVGSCMLSYCHPGSPCIACRDERFHRSRKLAEEVVRGEDNLWQLIVVYLKSMACWLCWRHSSPSWMASIIFTRVNSRAWHGTAGIGRTIMVAFPAKPPYTSRWWSTPIHVVRLIFPRVERPPVFRGRFLRF